MNRLRIREVETRLYRVPPAVPWEDATHRVTELEFLILRLQTEGGLSGFGLAYSIGVGASAIRAMVDDYCLSLLIGRDITDYERVWWDLSNNLHRTGSGGTNTLAVATIDIAVWDLLAKARSIPLFRLLGGFRSSLPAYKSGIDIVLSAEQLGEMVATYVGAGYDAVKIKVGRLTLREDVERVAAARRALGDDRRLLLDANQRWHLDEAVERLAAFEPYRPAWIEEPLRAEDIAGHARLRQVSRIPIAVGESLYTKEDFLDYLRADAVDILQPDVARVGGFTECLKVAHLAEAWGRRISPHYLSELSVHLLCAIPNGIVLEEVEGGGLAEMGLISKPAVVRDGTAAAPLASGHGLDFDFQRLTHLEVTAKDIRSADTTIFKQ